MFTVLKTCDLRKPCTICDETIGDLREETGNTCRLVEIRCRNDWEPYKEAIESMMNNAWQRVGWAMVSGWRTPTVSPVEDGCGASF